MFRISLDGYPSVVLPTRTHWGSEPVHVNVRSKHLAACRRLWNLIARRSGRFPS